MASAKITVELSKLQSIQRGIDTAFSEGLSSAGSMIVELASQLAPKDTGDLSNSGESILTTPRMVEVSFGNGLSDSRAVVQEYGSVLMPAQPYLTPALRAVDIGLEVQKALKRIL